MRYTTCALAFFLVLFIVTGGLPCAAVAEITWDDDQRPFDEFLFEVQKNGGTFIYAPSQYFQQSSDTESCSYRPSQSETDPYDCIANGDSEAYITPPGDIRLKAMAKGPDGGISLPNGLMVQGYLETIPSALTDDHALNTEQDVTAWVNRRFSVDREGLYNLRATLTGTVNFDAYNNISNDQAIYGVVGTLSLEEIIDDQVFLTVFTKSLSDSEPTFSKNVRLKPQTDSGETITYRLKITLELGSRIANFDPQSGNSYRAVDGTYRLGSQSEPFILEATLSPGASASWMNLLLSD